MINYCNIINIILLYILLFYWFKIYYRNVIEILKLYDILFYI